MTFVVDASIAAAWLLPDEGDETTLAILKQLRQFYGLAPSIFRHEARNILLIAERRGRLDQADLLTLLVDLSKLPILDDGAGDDVQIIELARAHKLTSYDAAYLALALSTGAPLATLDRRLAEAARAAGVTVLGRYAAASP